VKKVILYSLAVLLLASGIWGCKLIWGKPFNIDHFFDRYLIGAALSEPEILTIIGVVDNTVMDFHSHKLTDASPVHDYKMLERSIIVMLPDYIRRCLYHLKNFIKPDLKKWSASKWKCLNFLIR
jgi:hypothetical protein